MPKINKEGLELIKHFEGLSLKAYLCPAGIMTIGYGSTFNVKKGQTITDIQAEDILKRDLDFFEKGVQKLVKTALTPNIFSATIAFAFNIGLGALADSTFLKKLNNKDFQGAADELLRWNKADGHELPGLTLRRKAERELFLKP